MNPDAKVKSEVPLRVDEYGRVLCSGIHDSYLTGFGFSEDGVLRFTLRGVAGEQTSFILTGVSESIFADMYSVAKVSDVFVWSVATAPDAWDIPDSAWNVLFASRYGAEGTKEGASRVKSTKPDAYLVQVGCSYGGSIVAVCDGVAISRE